jgi:ABC-type polysaccharide/polyol phosphate export permease
MASKINLAFADFGASLKNYPLWYSMGWLEIKQRYRRSILGPFWLTINLGMMIFGIGIVYSSLFGADMADFLPFFAAGMIIWTLISTLLVEGSSCFIGSTGLIRQIKMPLNVHVFRLIWRNLIILLHNMVIYFITIIFYKKSIPLLPHYFLLGLCFIILFGVGISLFLGALSARFRDIPLMIGSIVQVLLFVTPIMWKPDDLKRHTFVMDFNPLYYLIEVPRLAMLGVAPSMNLILITALISLACFIIGFITFIFCRRHIAYWL